jgi:hypothetical protein
MIFSMQDGTTSLIAAVQSGHDTMVQLLLEHKADPRVADQVPLSESPPSNRSLRVTISNHQFP